MKNSIFSYSISSNTTLSNSNNNTNYSQNSNTDTDKKNNYNHKNNFTSNSCPNLFNLYNKNENFSLEFMQLQKGFKDVKNMYKACYQNNFKDKRNISLQCNYYCNLNPSLFEDSYDEYDEDLKI